MNTRLAALSFYMALGFGAHVVPAQGAGLTLVTEAEVARERAYTAGTPDDVVAKAAPAIGAPMIDVQAPSLESRIKSPLVIQVAFKAGSDAEIDASSFRIFYGAIKVDITDRVLKFVRPTKEGLTVSGAEIPPGKHKLLMRVRDSKDRVGELALSFTVEEEVRAKDIVLASLAGNGAAPAQAPNGMSVSVLVASPDGTLQPRPASAAFRTGESFRLRVLPTADGTLVVSNTNPQGATRELLRMPVKGGIDTVVPGGAQTYLQLVGDAGEDVLHVHLYAAGTAPQAAVDALSKDIRVTTESTGNASYVVGSPAEPLYTRVVIRHQR